MEVKSKVKYTKFFLQKDSYSRNYYLMLLSSIVNFQEKDREEKIMN